jgi:type IV secretory pathway component VirB8
MAHLSRIKLPSSPILLAASSRLANSALLVLSLLVLAPYSARIEFEKVYTNPADHSELKRERWTASVTYVFRENVKNNELAVNPLGLTIVRFRADQAFS